MALRVGDLIRRVRNLLADRADGKDQTWKMIGEFFRELGVLIIVFYPIESGLRGKPWGPAAIVASGIFCVVVGIVIERRR